MATLERYAEANEDDLARQGNSLVEHWNNRRWRLLRNLINHLPRDSHYWHAISQDEELAEQWLAREEAGEYLGDEDEIPVPLHEWSPAKESLARLEEITQQIVAAVTASAGGKPAKVKPAARPNTALQRAREARRIRLNHAFMDLLVPEGREN